MQIGDDVLVTVTNKGLGVFQEAKGLIINTCREGMFIVAIAGQVLDQGKPTETVVGFSCIRVMKSQLQVLPHVI